MKKNAYILPVLILLAVFIAACDNSDEGSETISSTDNNGTISISVTDAKPMLPEGVAHLWITFEAVHVHKEGGAWISLPMRETPFTIDLLQFYDGNTTELVPPVELENGIYTQIRISMISATIGVINGALTEIYAVDIPSDDLKTDENFMFDIMEQAAINITVDFDLSRSIVVMGPAGAPSYKLKPVLHIVETSQAASIHGSISNAAFGDTGIAVVTVIMADSDEIYTTLEVALSETEDPTLFDIYWLVPEENYRIEVDLDPDMANGYEFEENVTAFDLGPGIIYYLNDDNPID